MWRRFIRVAFLLVPEEIEVEMVRERCLYRIAILVHVGVIVDIYAVCHPRFM